MGLISAGLSAFGAYGQGHAAAQSAQYNAKIAAENSQVSKDNANMVLQAGAQQAAEQSFKTRAAIGDTVANQAAGGLDINSGSPLDVKASEREIGEQDALTVRSNATKEAYGQQVQAVNQDAQSGLDKYEAKSDELGAVVNSATTFIGSATDSASTFAKFQLAGGFGG